MNLLHIIKDLDLGGTEHLFAKHIRQLAGQYPEFSNQVIVLGRRASACDEYLDMLPVQPVFLEFSGRYRKPLSSWRRIRQLRALIRQGSPDLIHSYLWNADVFTEIARLGSGVPQVAHVVDRRGDRNSPRLPSRFKTRLTGWLHRRGGTRFVAVSEACRAHALRQFRLAPDTIITAHNGIPIEQFEVTGRAVDTDRPVVAGTISNFKEEKGHRYLIEAFRQLADARVPVILKIAGDGRARPEFEALVGRLGLVNCIEFVGRVPSAAAFYRDIDLFMIPSIYAEGLPTTILEAMAARLPIVATDVGGATEAIRDAREGRIVPPRDVSALAAAIRELVENRALMRRMGEAGHARVGEQFTLERMTRIIVEQVYRPLLQEKSVSVPTQPNRSMP